MVPLKIFYHLTDLPGWDIIAQEQFNKLHSSDLLYLAEIYVNLHYTESSFDGIKKVFENYKNVKFVFNNSLREDFEHPTFILMQDVAENSNEEFYGLYMHQKGITYLDKPPHNLYTTHWRWLLDYWNIERWKDCVKKLDEGYDAVGALYFKHGIHQMPLFAGCTRWTKASFLRKSPKLLLPSKNNFIRQTPKAWPNDNNPQSYRYDLEMWPGYCGAKMYSLYDDPNQDGYHKPYPPEWYRGKPAL